MSSRQLNWNNICKASGQSRCSMSNSLPCFMLSLTPYNLSSPSITLLTVILLQFSLALWLPAIYLISVNLHFAFVKWWQLSTTWSFPWQLSEITYLSILARCYDLQCNELYGKSIPGSFGRIEKSYLNWTGEVQGTILERNFVFSI